MIAQNFLYSLQNQQKLKDHMTFESSENMSGLAAIISKTFGCGDGVYNDGNVCRNDVFNLIRC